MKQRVASLWAFAVLTSGLFTAQMALGDSVTIGPSKDNTLYRETGSFSNGAGQNFFAGHTGVLTNSVRRAVIAFDIAASVPAGSTIDSVALTLHLSRAPLGAGSTPIALHRLLADWGEGTSDPLFGEGGGAPATTGDATWLHRFFNTIFWTRPGGDFSPTASAARTVIGVAFYTWGPTAQMRGDVQDWLDNPSSDFGWLLMGDEVTLQSARGFDSRQSLTPANRPVLTVTFTPSATAAGRVPDGAQVPGTPLMVKRAPGGEIGLTWSQSCLPTDNDFEIYEGTLGVFYSHTMKFCTTGGASTSTFLPAAGSTYYLVVPRNGPREGSYGTDGSGQERPSGVPACLAQEIAVCP